MCVASDFLLNYNVMQKISLSHKTLQNRFFMCCQKKICEILYVKKD